jgi:hypothetical protein
MKTYDNVKQKMREWLFHHLPPCEAIVEKISRSMEQKLSLRERVDLKLHLWICAWCHWYLENLNLIRDAASGKAVDPSDPYPISGPALSSEARERIKRQLTGGN